MGELISIGFMVSVVGSWVDGFIILVREGELISVVKDRLVKTQCRVSQMVRDSIKTPLY